jgi:hypothetical protein
MSRKTFKFTVPVKVFQVECHSIAYGLDHAVGWFLSGFDAKGNLVLDRDTYGFAMCDSPMARISLSHGELAQELRKFGLNADADRIGMDLDIIQ